MALRSQITAELVSNAALSDNTVATAVGCSYHTVAAVRADLISSGRLRTILERLEASGRRARGRRRGTRVGSSDEPLERLCERLLAEAEALGVADPVRSAAGMARRAADLADVEARGGATDAV
jgi:hypothetical protein